MKLTGEYIVSELKKFAITHKDYGLIITERNAERFAEDLVKNCSIPDVINEKRTVCHSCKEDIADCFVPKIKDLRCPECGNQWHTDL